VSIVAEIERELATVRCRREDARVPELRTSTLTHVAWVPPRWLEEARATLDGLEERHPARTILLVPEPRRADGVAASVDVRELDRPGADAEVLSEVIEVRLRGRASQHPASVVRPLLVSDLPVFCRWRGDLDLSARPLRELVQVVDRLIVDSAEWRGLTAGLAALPRLFGRVSVSDLTYRRALPWRARLAELWPGIRTADTLRVTGPRADAVLLAGWLRSRLRRDVRLVHRRAPSLAAVAVDGAEVDPPETPAEAPSDWLSAELEVLGRDRVYEAAVRRAV
jgi:glucose-6-phosphate dehydrogenase assembly protein OpcA